MPKKSMRTATALLNEQGDAPDPSGAISRRAVKTLPRNFYAGSPERVAREIIGKVLVSTAGARTLAGRIVEAEAYHGADDPAAHAFAGKTLRNAVLFGPPGFAYVYFIYGMHFCLNVSCETDGTGGGVLFRALEPLDDFGGRPGAIAEMRRLRGLPDNAPLRLIAAGPGRLCQVFGITRANTNGLDFTDSASPLQIVDDGFHAKKIVATPRIGISKAAERPLRFYLAGSPFISGRR
jgi:DNA-3-methyladenine glycosylase